MTDREREVLYLLEKYPERIETIIHLKESARIFFKDGHIEIFEPPSSDFAERLLEVENKLI